MDPRSRSGVMSAGSRRGTALRRPGWLDDGVDRSQNARHEASTPGLVSVHVSPGAGTVSALTRVEFD
jgi:hypothetical protein